MKNSCATLQKPWQALTGVSSRRKTHAATARGTMAWATHALHTATKAGGSERRLFAWRPYSFEAARRATPLSSRAVRCLPRLSLRHWRSGHHGAWLYACRCCDNLAPPPAAPRRCAPHAACLPALHAGTPASPALCRAPASCHHAPACRALSGGPQYHALLGARAAALLLSSLTCLVASLPRLLLAFCKAPSAWAFLTASANASRGGHSPPQCSRLPHINAAPLLALAGGGSPEIRVPYRISFTARNHAGRTNGNATPRAVPRACLAYHPSATRFSRARACALQTLSLPGIKSKRAHL